MAGYTKNVDWLAVLKLANSTRACSSVDRASGSGPEGRGFESLHAR